MGLWNVQNLVHGWQPLLGGLPSGSNSFQNQSVTYGVRPNPRHGQVVLH